MTLANRITITRIILIPVFAVLIMSFTREEQVFRYAALAVFIVASVSDGLDGFVARVYNQKTRLGAVLDPMADKLLINVAFVFLAVNRELAYPIPAWFPVIMLSRDVIISIGAYLINELYGPVNIRPRFSGKLNTVLQMATVYAVLLDMRFTLLVVYVTLAVSVVSFFDYLRDGVKQIGNEDISHD